MWAGPSLFFGDDRDRQRNVHVRVQMQYHEMLTDRPDRAARQAHFAALDLESTCRDRFGDVSRADRTEKLTFAAGLGSDAKLEVLQSGRALLGGVKVFLGLAFELGAPRLEPRHVLRGRHGRFALRQQEIARIAWFYFDAITDAAKVGDFLKENDVHARALSAGRCMAAVPGS